jgi:hypothetical protein
MNKSSKKYRGHCFITLEGLSLTFKGKLEIELACFNSSQGCFSYYYNSISMDIDEELNGIQMSH